MTERIGRNGENPQTDSARIGLRQKIKIEKHGSSSRNLVKSKTAKSEAICWQEKF